MARSRADDGILRQTPRKQTSNNIQHIGTMLTFQYKIWLFAEIRRRKKPLRAEGEGEESETYPGGSNCLSCCLTAIFGPSLRFQHPLVRQIRVVGSHLRLDPYIFASLTPSKPWPGWPVKTMLQGGHGHCHVRAMPSSSRLTGVGSTAPPDPDVQRPQLYSYFLRHPSPDRTASCLH